MTCRSCCRVVSIVVNTIIGLAAIAMVLYGGVTIFNVSLSSAQSDNLMNSLGQFINCNDVENAIPPRNDGTDSAFDNAILNQCNYAKAPYYVGFAAIALATLHRIITGAIASCSDHKFPSIAFPVFAATSMSFSVLVGIVIILVTQSTAASFLDCDNYSSATITRLEGSGFICIKGDGGTKNSAVTWMIGLGTFYAGCLCVFISSLIAILINGCCKKESKPANDSVTDPLMEHDYLGQGTYRAYQRS